MHKNNSTIVAEVSASAFAGAVVVPDLDKAKKVAPERELLVLRKPNTCRSN